MNKDLHDKIYDLLARKIAGNATPDELNELDRLLATMPDFKYLHDHLARFPEFDRARVDDVTDQAYAAQYVKMLYADRDEQLFSANAAISKQQANRRKRYFLTIAGIAAALTLLIVLAQLFFSQKEPAGIQGDLQVKNSTKPANSKSKLTLPDGTIVYLNVDSDLQYDGDFNKITRTVVLTGEAYFEVAHHPQKPFLVRTSKATIKVLGTKFNVKSYSDELWETTLLEGKIEMQLNSRPGEKLQLQPSQKVYVSDLQKNDSSNKDYKITVAKIKPLDNDVAETAWMTDKLVFVNKPLEEIAKDLERTFGISVEFGSLTAKQYRYTGAFQNDDLLQILKILDLSRHIDYELKGNVLIIK